MGISLFAGESEDRRLDDCCATPATASSSRSTITWTSCRSLEGEPPPFLPRKRVRRTIGQAVEHRSRPRLPLPVLVLHHHQRAGPQEPLSASPTISNASCARTTPRASSASSSPTTISRATSEWEPLFDRMIKLREDEGMTYRLHHPGRYALPQDSEFHREGDARRRPPRLHRAGEHQSGQSDRRQEAAEQDHRIPRDAAEMAQPRRASPMPAISSASRPTPRNRSCATSRSSSANCRSTFSNSSSSRRCRARKTTRCCSAQGRLDGPGHEQIRPQPPRHASCAKCRTRNGRRPIAPPGTRIYTPEHINTILRRSAPVRTACAEHVAVDHAAGSTS